MLHTSHSKFHSALDIRRDWAFPADRLFTWKIKSILCMKTTWPTCVICNISPQMPFTPLGFSSRNHLELRRVSRLKAAQGWEIFCTVEGLGLNKTSIPKTYLNFKVVGLGNFIHYWIVKDERCRIIPHHILHIAYHFKNRYYHIKFGHSYFQTWFWPIMPESSNLFWCKCCNMSSHASLHTPIYRVCFARKTHLTRNPLHANNKNK